MPTPVLIAQSGPSTLWRRAKTKRASPPARSRQAESDDHPAAVFVSSCREQTSRTPGGNPDGSDKLELYDLKADVGEAKDLAAEKPALVKELNALIIAYLKDTEAVVP